MYSQRAQNKAAAEEYINFMCSHEIALANAEMIGYSSPITSVEQDPEYSYYNDEVVYPSAEILSRGEVLYLDADTQKIMDDGWSQVKRTEIGSFVYAIVALVLVAATAFIIVKGSQKGRVSKKSLRLFIMFCSFKATVFCSVMHRERAFVRYNMCGI